METSVQLPSLASSPESEAIAGAERKIEAARLRLASKERTVKLKLKKLTNEDEVLEEEKKRLGLEADEIERLKKLRKLNPRQAAVDKEIDALAVKKSGIRHERDGLANRLREIKTARKIPTSAERDIAKRKAELTEEMKAVRKKEAGLSRQAKDLALKMQSTAAIALQKAEERRQAKSDPRKALLKKQFGGVHPETVANYIPEVPPVLHDSSKDAYGKLTDESTYSEYAWAFLRRNRFYQRLIDKAIPNITEENWEYADDSEQQCPIGLMNLKHYKEPFLVGVPVEWWGIHSFQQQLSLEVPSNQALSMIGVIPDWPETQVSLLFDIGPLLGETTAAIDAQICIAKAYLQKLAKSKGVSFPKKLKPPDKSLFRAQLRIADQLSSRQLPPSSTESNDQGNKKEKRLKTWLSMSQVAELLPEYDLKRKAANGAATTRKQKINRASELCKGAWDNIYNWKFLQALQFDNWAHLAIPKKKTNKSSQVAAK